MGDATNHRFQPFRRAAQLARRATAIGLATLALLAGTAEADPVLKLLRYRPAGQERPGILDSDRIFRDLSRVISDVTPALSSGDSPTRLRAIDAKRLPLVAPGIRLGTPVAGVRKIVAVGLNHAAHAALSGGKPPTEPKLSLKGISALSGPNDPVIRPKSSTAPNYGVELVTVISRTACNASEADAGRNFAGYAVRDDFSERDFQMRHESQLAKGKSAGTRIPLT